MQAYPGHGNPVINALKGKISTRQLRVMIEHLPKPNAVTREIAGNDWHDVEWMLWDVSTQLRLLRTNFYNANRGNDTPAEKFEPLPNPKTFKRQATEARTPEKVASDRAHFRAVLNRNQS